MKTIILFVAFIIYFNPSFAQQSNIDSLKTEILKLKAYQQYSQLNFELARKEHASGVTFIFVGLATMGAGTLFIPDENGGTNKVSNVLFIAGGAMSLVGYILTLDSHKFYGRIGNWQFQVK